MVRVILTGLLIGLGLVVAPSAAADPPTCPPTCDQIPAAAWPDPWSIPLNGTYRWPVLAGVAAPVQASRFRFEELCNGPRPLGDPREASVRSALDFLAGRSCTPITASAAEAGGRSAQSTKLSFAERVLLMPTRPAPVQREAPGTF